MRTSYQAVELGHWALAARLADVPDLDATFAPGVDVTRGVADGDGAHHLPVAQRVDLTGVAWDARAYQCIWREGHGLHLTIRTNVKRIRSAEDGGREKKKKTGQSELGEKRLLSVREADKSKTHGFPPEMDVRLAGRPGALM